MLRAIVAIFAFGGLLLSGFFLFVATGMGAITPVWWWLAVVIAPVGAFGFCFLGCFQLVPTTQLKYGRWATSAALLPAIVYHLISGVTRGAVSIIALGLLTVVFLGLWLVMSGQELRLGQMQAGPATSERSSS